jgi:hypothetical protein
MAGLSSTTVAQPARANTASLERRQERAHEWTATGLERPVFLDERGRRRRWVLTGGALSGGAAALWLGGLLAGAVGFASLPANLPVPAALARRGGDVPRRAVVADSGRARATAGGRDVESRVSGRPAQVVAAVAEGKSPARTRS